ncbi:hypothetical protein [Melghirimyces profundicolus]|uniref:hypothetical protein n=1 Tax=Melghirimyces profundicolus TaxID=1242148 RepID=UPI0014750F47|nr:hypothetical protein [Melghirimyces profundicolus]
MTDQTGIIAPINSKMPIRFLVSATPAITDIRIRRAGVPIRRAIQPQTRFP